MFSHLFLLSSNRTSWGAIVFSVISAKVIAGEGEEERVFKKFKLFFLYVTLKLCAKFQFPTVPATGQKVCGGVVWWWWVT